MMTNIGVIGGGTAGYFAAIALKRADPSRRVTLVESSKIPIIGVGEATTPPMLPFLHHVLGIDVVDFYARVQPTWKLGIKFEWGARPFFNYPFGEIDLVDALVHEDDLLACSLTSLLMARDRVPVFEDVLGVDSALGQLRFAYHLDNRRFVAYLAEHARRAGVDYLDRTVTGVVVTPNGDAVDHLATQEGDPLRFDLFVDATGFRSLLIEGALASPYLPYDTTLYCDRAVVANVPHGGAIKPYTLAETMDAGWCWNIPQVDEDHRGYVYSSAFLDVDQAAAEMRRKNPGMSDFWTVKFRSGRHRDFWLGNVVAIGNAYGFVEPLESTALHMVILEVLALGGELERWRRDGGEPDRARLSALVGDRWDYLRWFLGLHYRFNARLDTPFWQECRRRVDITGLDEWVDRFRAAGPLTAQGVARDARDAVFGPRGVDIMLLGQGVPCPLPAPRTPVEAWRRHREKQARLLGRACPQARALEILRGRPDLLAAAIAAPGSWCAAGGDELRLC
jgi:tryptophan halogenase